MRRNMRCEVASMPTTAYDPGLLREQDTAIVIKKNWFLDQKIPGLVAGMGRASGRNENHHEGRSDYMPETRMRMENH